MNDQDREYIENLEEKHREQIRAISRRIRQIADDIECDVDMAKNNEWSPANITAFAIHKVTWGVANLGLDGLVKQIDEIERVKEYVRNKKENTDAP